MINNIQRPSHQILSHNTIGAKDPGILVNNNVCILPDNDNTRFPICTIGDNQ